MTTYSLSDLRTAETQGVIEARLVAALNARGLPTGSWASAESGGPELTTVRMISGTLAKLVSAKMAEATKGRFLDLATGDFLTFLASRFFQLDRQPATSTIQSVWLTLAPAAPAIDFEAGEVWVSATGGNRYQSLDAINLGPLDQAPFRFQAENPGAAYNDPLGTITLMTTAPAGVSCVNRPADDYLPAHQLGFSTGHVSAVSNNPDHRGDPVGVSGPVYDSIRVRIDSDGDVGAATFHFSLDGGDHWTDAGPVLPSYEIPGPPGDELSGVILKFTNGSPPSFIKGSIFTLIRASAIQQQGADAWSDATLRKLCRARWATLSDVVTEGAIQLWAHLASPEVRKVFADADPNTPGSILVTIASSAGPATGAAQLAVAEDLEPRLRGFKGVPAPASGVGGSPEEVVLVRSAVAHPITMTGTVSVPRAKLAAVQKEADRLWRAYLEDLDLGGVVILAEAEQALMDAGATTFAGILLNGVNQNVALLAREIAVPADGTSLVTSLSWRPV